MRSIFFIVAFLSTAIHVVAAPLWSENELRVLKSLSLLSLSSSPESPSNRYANNPEAAAFGQQLFFDKRLSGNGEVACASCHQPEKYFTDGLPVSRGTGTTSRNAPTVVGSAWLHWFYWDGRRDSLWSQALIPFEAPNEMGSDRVAVVRLVLSDKSYRQNYEKLFGRVTDKFDLDDLPANAGPLADSERQQLWQRIPQNTRQSINRIYSNLGKAIAAYERTLVPKPTRFDHYVQSLIIEVASKTQLTPDEIAGIKLFIDTNKTQCLQCHNGALLTNGGFHNIGTGNFSGDSLDFGRAMGVPAVLMDEFNCLSEFSDAQPAECVQLRFLNKKPHIPLQGAFKTPSLRNLSKTAPYFHDGRFASVEEVIDFYNNPPINNGAHELKAMLLSQQEKQQLIEFLNLFNEN